MDVGILGILGSVIGTGLAVVIVIVGLGWRAMARLEARLDRRMDRMEDAHRADTARVEERIARVEHGQAKLEGLLEGLREAIAGRRAA